MSSALAIASVTYVLKDLLNNGLIDHNVTATTGVSVEVTALPPDRIDTDSEESRLNLFMYMATPNPGWRNWDYPSRNSSGERISNPPLALDLHYLLTAYGGEEFHHEILLGYGMQLFHENPVLPREAIRRSLEPPTDVDTSTLPLSLRALATSELAEQVEQIKIAPEMLNTEEISRLWTAFGAKYRPHAAYKATVVLIESQKPAKAALPVQQRNLYVRPFQLPVVERIRSQAADGAPIVENQKILAGYNLVIDGRQLRGEVTTVNIDGIEITPAAASLSDSRIIVPLPAGLPAGIHALQVVHEILMGSPPVPHRGVSSNVEAFVLSPEISGGVVNVADTAVNTDGLWSANIEVTLEPAVGPAQRVVLLLNQFNVPNPAAYTFQMPALPPQSPPGPVANISIPASGVRAGTYLARVRVDGAESPLGVDAAFNYNSPTADIP